MAEHIPVLLEETLETLNPQECSVVVDGTFGRGGHALALLKHLPPSARYYAFDKDPDAIACAEQLAEADPRIIPIHASFADCRKHLLDRQVQKVDGILLDLGVSSPQLDDAHRGFSFSKEGPLDMRMDSSASKTAAAWVNSASAQEIATVLYEYGQEKKSRHIARRIVEARQENPIETTQALAELVRSVVPSQPGKDGATRTFQAIRMHINSELEDIRKGLKEGFDLLDSGGRFCVITFHSLEDGLVKRFMQSLCKPVLPKGLPIPDKDIPMTAKWVAKTVRPKEHELNINPRSRSATLRVLEKI
jgi:16S rRNA (cytosine1402-N4)-methyltransferase